LEEDRQFIRVLIQQSRADTIKLFDDILEEFDKLPRYPVYKRKYHSHDSIIRYNRNLGVIHCKLNRSMRFILTMIKGIKSSLNYREQKAEKLRAVYNNAKDKVNNVNCRRSPGNEPVL